jgi:hypothetical protein
MPTNSGILGNGDKDKLKFAGIALVVCYNALRVLGSDDMYK